MEKSAREEKDPGEKSNCFSSRGKKYPGIKCPILRLLYRIGVFSRMRSWIGLRRASRMRVRAEKGLKDEGTTLRYRRP